MIIDIRNLLNGKLTATDILINDISTYPKDLQKIIQRKEFCGEDFLNYFYKYTNYSVIGVHFTRLFDYEIKDIISNGLHSDTTSDYERKIKRMPVEFDCYKNELIEYVSYPYNKRSDGNIYFDVGKIEIADKNNIFLKNWGGETLYCFYDTFERTEQGLQLASILRKFTIPCLVIVKVNAYQFFDKFLDIYGLIENIKNNTLTDYSNEFNILADEVSVISVIPVKYKNKDVS